MFFKDRWTAVKEKNLCFNCLAKGHQTTKCQSKNHCQKPECGKNHHSLLHRETIQEAPPDLQPVGNIVQNVSVGTRILLRTLLVKVKGPKGIVLTTAYLDNGSTVSLIDADLSRQLGLKGEKSTVSLSWTNSLTKSHEVVTVALKICGASDTQFFKIDNVKSIKDLNLPHQKVNLRTIKNNWPHLRHLNICEEGSAPKILLGQDQIDLILVREAIEGLKNAPVTTRTKLGWTIHGHANQFKGRLDPEITLFSFQEDESITRLFKDFSSTESFGVRVTSEKPRSVEDKRALTILDKTTKRVSPEKWETGLLWKDENCVLPQSKSTALSRLFSLERKLDKNPEYAAKYYKKMDHYLDMGYIKKISEEKKLASDGNKEWYLPDFGVVNPKKPDKLRLVFGAAAKTNGLSLNDFLLTGPDLLTSLPSILLNFRKKKIAFTGDIREMFHQILMRYEDLVSQKILWRGRDRDRDPGEMEMRVVIFGITNSPSSAQFVKNKNALEFIDTYPVATEAIIRRHYVDDYLDCTDDEESAIKLIQDVTHVHKFGGFDIASWMSNSPKVMESISDDHKSTHKVESNKSLNLDSDCERVLGLY